MNLLCGVLQMLAGFMTVTETAEKWNLNKRTIQIMCSDGRIEGAAKFGKYWAIPIDAKKTIDHRITSGQYKNWRDKIVNRSENEGRFSELEER